MIVGMVVCPSRNLVLVAGLAVGIASRRRGYIDENADAFYPFGRSQLMDTRCLLYF